MIALKKFWGNTEAVVAVELVLLLPFLMIGFMAMIYLVINGLGIMNVIVGVCIDMQAALSLMDPPLDVLDLNCERDRDPRMVWPF